MIIKKIYYGDCNTTYCYQNGCPSYSEDATRTVSSIVEHRPVNNGDMWYYDVSFDNGEMERIFNPKSVVYGGV